LRDQVGGEDLLVRHHRDAVLFLHALGELPSIRREHRRDVLGDLSRRHTAAQTADRRVIGAAIHEVARRKDERQHDRGRRRHFNDLERRRQNADHRIQTTVETNGPADDAGVCTEPRRPQRVPEDGHRWRSRREVLCNESAPEVGFRAEHIQKVRRHPSALNRSSGVVFAQLRLERPKRRQSVEDPAVVVEELKAAGRKRSDRSLLPPSRAEINDALRVRVRERMQNDTIERVEHRGRRADAKRQRHDHHRREHRLPRERPRRVPHIRHDTVDPIAQRTPALRLERHLFDLRFDSRVIAEPPARLPLRLDAGPAVAHQLFDATLEVKGQLGFDVVVQALTVRRQPEHAPQIPSRGGHADPPRASRISAAASAYWFHRASSAVS
jgi:hypothetical protein